MLARLSMWLLQTMGWTVTADYPDTEKYVLIVAPHTSNWDFVVGLLANWALRLHVRYIGKHTLFYWPWGWIFRRLGGVPVRRGHSTDMIRQITRMFENSDRLVLALAPEGTRSKTDHWKSGFYHIARAAHVPIVMGYLDFGHKRAGLGAAFCPGDDLEADFDRIRDFYRDKLGKHPEKASLIRARH